MSTSMLMSLGTSALAASLAQLQTTSNNIANANSPGYSRQQVQLAPSEGQFSGSGFFGRGVTVQTVSRASNLFLTSQAAAASSAAGADGARRDMLRQLEGVFGSGAAGLGQSATNLFNAFADLAAAPSDLSARQAVLARVEDFVSLARSEFGQLGMLQANAAQDVRNSIQDVNTLAAQVAELNLRIATARGTGHAPNDLMDARDQLVSRISAQVEVHTIDAADGSTSVFVAGGQSLVLGGLSNQLVALPDRYDAAKLAVGISVGGSVTPLPSDTLGGSVGGLLQFQDGDLTDAGNRLGQLTAALATTMNRQQSFGIDLAGVSGAPLFQLGAPVALAAQGNAGNAALTLAITDASALQASDYRLVPDPAAPGLYQVTRLSDGVVRTGVASGDVVDGFSITVGAPAPAAGDSFLLRPVGNAVAGLAPALADPRAIAAASPLTAAASGANSGSAAVQSIDIVAPPTAAYQSMTVRFNDASGNYDLLDATSAVVGSGSWSAGTPISWNGFALSLGGAPLAGDRIAITPTSVPAASNGNALAFDRLASGPIVAGQTFGDAYAGVLSDVGVQVQGAVAAADTSSAVLSRANAALGAETGVNLDEEAARLMQYQQSYQAAAKMLQTAQTVLDTVLQLGR